MVDRQRRTDMESEQTISQKLNSKHNRAYITCAQYNLLTLHIDYTQHSNTTAECIIRNSY